MITRQFQANVKIVRSDNDTEFKPLLPYFSEHGILFQTSCVGTPLQNGRIEHKHRHILNVVRVLMFQADLPVRFWGECILGAVHLINWTPCGLLDGWTAIEVITCKVPDFDHLRVFGCLCFVHDQQSRDNKFAPRSGKYVFVGYPKIKKGGNYMTALRMRCLSPDVRFMRKSFPTASSSPHYSASLGLDQFLLVSINLNTIQT
ncbi:hypothetical protein LIER_22538 [Lithospermum erythrorhizon]|uniref:Integrase catalytic domain-containing protein n=1 Tax=Lithospermum erythrorhizon TaxID=34254 RepID=A0AAV3QYH4_LITER